jgi:molybdenum cofactor cytidylyltransferase
MKARPVLIVLAAGRGSRFGGSEHKLRQPLGNSSVLGEGLRRAVASRLPVVVVTTVAMAEEARRTIASRDVLIVPGSETLSDVSGASPLGIGYSIAAGVAARPDASGWMILPADMPLVRATTLSAVASQLDHHAVVYAQYQGRRGHPVGFSSELYSELVSLQGDEGARRLVARYPAHAVEVDDPGVLIDIDTEADLIAARAAHASRGDSAYDSKI